MTIEIRMCADEFTRNADPRVIEHLDLPSSFRNFERLLSAELQRIHPSAEITVHVLDIPKNVMLVDNMQIGAEDHPAAWDVHAHVEYALDKIFMSGRFWVDYPRR